MKPRKNTIVTLGPPGTFSDTAASLFSSQLNAATCIEYRPSIPEVFEAFSEDDCADYCVIPVENLSEGFISLVLDNIERRGLFIVWEHLLPVSFAFVSNCPDLARVSKVYAQFVARGQCAVFLASSVGHAAIQTTQSNMASLNEVVEADACVGAIVPSSAFTPGTFAIEVPDVTDRSNNATRFLALARHGMDEAKEGVVYKTSLLVKDGKDKPGELRSILECFAARGINLASIVSRPTGNVFGQYCFYIDVEGHANDECLGAALAELRASHAIQWLGSYAKSGV